MPPEHTIAAELAELGIIAPQVEEGLQDAATGDIDYWWRGSGRPMQFAYAAFNPVNAIRILENWDVTGTALPKYPGGGSIQFSITVDHGANSVRLTFGVPYWEGPLVGGAMRVLNSAATGELLVRFTAEMRATNDTRFTMLPGSYLLIKDTGA